MTPAFRVSSNDAKLILPGGPRLGYLGCEDGGIGSGILAPAPLNAITDVAGVLVGQTTLIMGDSVRTGATAILPHSGHLYQNNVPAAVFVFDGFGKSAGLSQVAELGEIETPIVLTNTLSGVRT